VPAHQDWRLIETLCGKVISACEWPGSGAWAFAASVPPADPRTSDARAMAPRRRRYLHSLDIPKEEFMLTLRELVKDRKVYSIDPPAQCWKPPAS